VDVRKMILAVVAIALTGCASMRGVDVGSESVSSFRVSVVTMSYTAAGGNRIELGTVAAKATQQFVIAGAAGSSVTIMAANSSGTTVGSYPVTIESGSTRQITVR
jgi:hypothetical protein